MDKLQAKAKALYDADKSPLKKVIVISKLHKDKDGTEAMQILPRDAADAFLGSGHWAIFTLDIDTPQSVKNALAVAKKPTDILEFVAEIEAVKAEAESFEAEVVKVETEVKKTAGRPAKTDKDA